MEKLDIKGFVYTDYTANGDEIKIKASWVVGNKKVVNLHWLNYGDESVDKQLCATKDSGKNFTNEDIYALAEGMIEKIKAGKAEEIKAGKIVLNHKK